jgi:alkaline phosphatase
MFSAEYFKKLLVIVLVAIICCSGLVQAAPKNVIIFIGDGMGPQQVKAGGIYVYGAAGSLSFEAFPYQGELTTYQYGGGVPDSAAAATSLATGYKVNGGVVSMAYPANPDYTEGSELPTLLEYFKALGKSMGLVSTAYLTDATAAAFGAHEPTRSNYSQIAGDYLNQTQPNVLFGGGANGMSRASAEAAGYIVVEDRASMLALDTESVTKVSGQFGSTNLPYEYDGPGNLPHLSEMTATALSILDNDTDGFFLMVEGGNIDHACHSNDLARTIPDVNEFANAVQAAINWAAGRSDTLIIVTADHETGGLTVLSNNGIGSYPDVSWGSTGHTATNVPAYAWGVNAGFVSGVLNNTDIFGIVTADTVILNSPSDESVLRDTQVSFTCSAASNYQLIDATLYLGQASGTSNTVTFSGSAATDDAQISADSPNTNYGAVTPINVDGLTPHAHSVIKFPNVFGSGPGQVPSGAVITSAILKVNCTNTGNIMKLYRLTEDWIEGQVTWNNRSSGTSWTAAGAQGGSNAGISIDGDCTALGWRTIDITQFVQEWSNGAPNYGIVTMDSGSDGVDFDSSESANLPLLTITYQSMQAIETKPLSGTSGSVTFSTLTLNDQTDYVWNCLVRSTNGQETYETWAPLDSQFRIDSLIPDEPVLVAPPDGATNASTSPTLEVTAGDPQDGSLNVTFYGRTVPSPDDYFTIIVLPDTQLYSKSYPAIFTAQTQWIVNNVTAQNIVFVTHEGDIVDVWNDTTQWQNANNSMSLLDGVVPYGVLAGNHDKLTDTLSGQYPDYPADSTYYNQYFPYTRYATQPWYGGHYGTTNNNNYQLFSAATDDYIILHLEDTPSTADISWADSVLKANADRKAIITTHSYLDISGNYNGKWGSTQYIRDMVVANSNVHFVLCGHLSTELTKTTTVGTRQVHELMADYQIEANGGNGWLRIMRFVPAENKVYVKTYSPWLGQYQTDNNSRFTLDFTMSQFRVIGTATAVPSGQNASIVWSGLSVGTQYEWFAEVTDSTANTRVGPVWSFTASTTDTTPPIISAVASSDITQTNATITWTTDEASNSVVKYGTTTPPTNEITDVAMVTSHSLTLTGLSAETPYFYEVKSTDAAGNTATDNNGGIYYTFTTLLAFPQTLFSDGFESGNLTAWGWTVSGSATVSTAAAYSGSYGAYLKKAASIQKALSTAGYKQIHIKFARKTTGMDAGEYLYAEWSTDGSVWNTLQTTQDTVWASRDLLCPAGADNSAGFRLRFRTNANLTAEYACVDEVEITGTSMAPDNDPPSPNPMTWVTVPYATGSTSIAMVATTASDVSGVEYYFTCTAGGGHDSGWQNSPTYEDMGLTPETSYTYTVKARDKSANQNETAVSTAESATTQPGGAAEVYVNNITMNSGISGKNYYAQATVWIRNNSGANVAAATVYGNWSGAVSGSANGVTGTDGKVILRSPNSRSGGTFTFTVTNVAASGYTYNPSLNVETSDSITNP